jgi:hypothetical protein
MSIGSVDPAGRVQLTLNPAGPSKCLICNRDANGETSFIDFDYSLDYYGAVNICEGCIQECLDVVNHEKVANLKLEITSKEDELRQTNEQLERYRVIMDGISLIRSDLDPANLASSDEPENEQPDVDESSGEGTDEQSDSDGQDSSGRPKNLPLFAD